MKNLFVFCLALAFAVPVFAADEINHFVCSAKEKTKAEGSPAVEVDVQIEFLIKNLSQPENAELLEMPGLGDLGPIKVTPQKLSDGTFPIAQTLNDQGGDLRIRKKSGNILLFGDGDGVQFIYLELYKDRNFGFAGLRYSGANEGFQQIHCSNHKQ